MYEGQELQQKLVKVVKLLGLVSYENEVLQLSKIEANKWIQILNIQNSTLSANKLSFLFVLNSASWNSSWNWLIINSWAFKNWNKERNKSNRDRIIWTYLVR